MRRSVLIVVALVTAAVLAGAQGTTYVPPVLEFVTPPGLEAAAVRLKRVDAGAFAEFGRWLGLRETGPPIRVVLAPADSDLSRATPSWIAGFADSTAGVIVLFPSRSPSYPSDSLEDVLRHEVAHVLIARAAGGAPVPRWLHEGLATAAEQQPGWTDQANLAMAAVSGPHSVAAFDREFEAGGRRAAMAYAASAAFVRDLIRRYGPGFPGRLLARLGSGETLEHAFLLTAGIPLSDAERAFWRTRWWSQVLPFLTSSLALWMGIVMLAMVAMRHRAKMRAERRRRWDEEDDDPAGEDVSEEELARETASLRPPAASVREPSWESETDGTRSVPPASGASGE